MSKYVAAYMDIEAFLNECLNMQLHVWTGQCRLLGRSPLSIKPGRNPRDVEVKVECQNMQLHNYMEIEAFFRNECLNMQLHIWTVQCRMLSRSPLSIKPGRNPRHVEVKTKCVNWTYKPF